MGQKFNLDEWLKNIERRVVTREGKPVKIICWDSPNQVKPIVGFVEGNSNPIMWDAFGYFKNGHIDSDLDLFFAEDNGFPYKLKSYIENTEKQSPTDKILDELKSYLENNTREQVEKDWGEIQDWYNERLSQKKEEESLSEFEKAISELTQKVTYNGNVLPIEDIKGYSRSLLKLATRELLPKWKRVENATGFTTPYVDRMVNLIIPDKEGKGYYIPMKDLIEKLPREEEEEK